MFCNKTKLLSLRCRKQVFFNFLERGHFLVVPSPRSHWDWQSCWLSVVLTLTVWTFLSCFSGVFIGCLITCVFTCQFVAPPEREKWERVQASRSTGIAGAFRCCALSLWCAVSQRRKLNRWWSLDPTPPLVMENNNSVDKRWGWRWSCWC